METTICGVLTWLCMCILLSEMAQCSLLPLLDPYAGNIELIANSTVKQQVTISNQPNVPGSSIAASAHFEEGERDSNITCAWRAGVFSLITGNNTLGECRARYEGLLEGYPLNALQHGDCWLFSGVIPVPKPDQINITVAVETTHGGPLMSSILAPRNIPKPARHLCIPFGEPVQYYDAIMSLTLSMTALTGDVIANLFPTCIAPSVVCWHTVPTDVGYVGSCQNISITCYNYLTGQPTNESIAIRFPFPAYIGSITADSGTCTSLATQITTDSNEITFDNITLGGDENITCSFQVCIENATAANVSAIVTNVKGSSYHSFSYPVSLYDDYTTLRETVCVAPKPTEIRPWVTECGEQVLSTGSCSENGTWVIPGDVTVYEPVIIVNNPTVIQGDAFLNPKGTIRIEDGAMLDIQGCLTMAGDLVVANVPEGQEYNVFTYRCGNGEFDTVTVEREALDECDGSTMSENYRTNKFSIVRTAFNKCDFEKLGVPTWGIALIAVGVLIILSAVFCAAIYVCVKQKRLKTEIERVRSQAVTNIELPPESQAEGKDTTEETADGDSTSSLDERQPHPKVSEYTPIQSQEQ